VMGDSGAGRDGVSTFLKTRRKTMRDLEKIKARKVYRMDKGKISLILATGITMGVMVFLVGLLLGLREPNEAEASSLDPLEALISGGDGSSSSDGGPRDVESGEPASELSLEYASRLSEDSEEGESEATAPPLVPAGGGDEPMPVEPELEAPDESDNIIKKGSFSLRIPGNPGEVAFEEPALSSMSYRGEKGVFTLHVNSFGNKIDAGGYVHELRKSGYKAFIVATKTDDRGMIYRVRIGPFFSKNEAEKFRSRFEEKEGVPTYVVKRILKK
jgi:hypothetical protein